MADEPESHAAAQSQNQVASEISIETGNEKRKKMKRKEYYMIYEIRD